MKAILEFSLPEDTEEHEVCLSGWKYKAILDEIDRYLRRKLDTDMSDEEYKAYEQVQNDIYGIINDVI